MKMGAYKSHNIYNLKYIQPYMPVVIRYRAPGFNCTSIVMSFKLWEGSRINSIKYCINSEVTYVPTKCHRVEAT